MVQSPRNPENTRERRKRKTPWWEKAAVLVALGLLIINILLWCSTKKAADAAVAQLRFYEYKGDRPWIWVEMPSSIHIEVGKPVTTNVSIVNYGSVPALVRAKMRLEVGPHVIEGFRKQAAEHPEATMLAPNTKNILQVVIRGNERNCDFPIESSQTILTREGSDKIMDGIASGTLDVAVYGRIFYASPGLPMREYSSIFCFYLLKDGKVSACTNEKDAYTNWIDPVLF